MSAEKNWRNSERLNKVGRSEQLCWSCKNFAVCKWSTDHTPIDGWDAEENTMLIGHDDRVEINYMIYDCPQFVDDSSWRYEEEL